MLCSPDIIFNGHWAGGYGLTGALTNFGTFRDTFVLSHELGHNFDSRHTHCYNGIPQPEDPPIDLCFSGDMTGGRPCYAGPTSLPPDGGSIMSYCHLQAATATSTCGSAAPAASANAASACCGRC